MANVQKPRNKMFPFGSSSVGTYGLITSEQHESSLWHFWYGHLNVKAIKLSSQKKMVSGLLSIDQVELCEGYLYSKQAKRPFPIDKARRATMLVELIHADVCGLMQTMSQGGSQ